MEGYPCINSLFLYVVCLLIVRFLLLLSEILIALFNSLRVHISMPFNPMHELFAVLLSIGVGQHKEVGLVVRECIEAKANTVKTRAHRFPPPQSLSVIHILLHFCFSTSSSSACT